MSEFADELRQRTFRYTLRIIRFCRTLPDTWVEREVGKQLLRARMGVTGNYWSCCRGRSGKEFVAKREGREIRAILSKSHKTAKENRRWKKRSATPS